MQALTSYPQDGTTIGVNSLKGESMPMAEIEEIFAG
jgi:hypothetical protein